ncbi:hypothetical protein PGT21_034393 [Puccinia graminis f. sp. tritici]|uniref:Uncharacterized protein n=1 Tax=Puccinia graminis f. sp. tritici TaxID=56615 RepID=A0A5B0NI11_PUCGR|nr:hypothetical protein PGT21_034393 [Puccinia graminis f. sp. tritici]
MESIKLYSWSTRDNITDKGERRLADMHHFRLVGPKMLDSGATDWRLRKVEAVESVGNQNYQLVIHDKNKDTIRVE